MKTQENPQDQIQRTGSQKRKLPLLTALAIMLLAASSAQAAFIVTIEQVGSDVVYTGSGSIDTSALMSLGSSFGVPFTGLTPDLGRCVGGKISPRPTPVPSVDNYSGASGPASFGPGSLANATSGEGDFVSIQGDGSLFVPVGYVTGNPLSFTDTIRMRTIAGLGITTDTYVWTWGSGATADSFTIYAGVPLPTPDSGSTVLLMGLGLASLGLLRRKVVA
jgi:hypothetical protein